MCVGGVCECVCERAYVYACIDVCACAVPQGLALAALEVIVAGDANEAVAQADLVTTVTPARAPLFDAEALQPGMVCVAVVVCDLSG